MKTIFSVALISIVARLFSLLSTQMYLAYYGTTDPRINIYNVAINIPNVLFTSIGAMLTTVIVPIYSGLLAKNKEAAKAFIDRILSYVIVFCVLLISLCMLIAPLMANLTGFGATEFNDYFIFAVRLLMPVMIFHGLSYVFQGYLQSNGRFKLTAAAALPSGLTIIAYLLLFGQHGVTGLLAATFTGLSLQALILLPSVWRTGYRFKPSLAVNEDIKRAAKLSVPMLLSASAFQINTLFNIFIAARLNASAIVNYVQNLLISSILTFVYSVTAVYYPKLSASFEKDVNEYKSQLSSILSLLLFFLIPAVMGFALVRYSLFDFISRFGNFTSDDVKTAGDLIALFSLGIPALGLKEVFDRAFYAQKNSRTSAMVGFIIMFTNVIVCLLLSMRISFFACALSYSISSSLGVFILYRSMCKRIGNFEASLGKNILKSIFATMIMGLIVYLSQRFINQIFSSDSLTHRGIRLFIPVFAGLCGYFVSAAILKVKEVSGIYEYIAAHKSRR